MTQNLDVRDLRSLLVIWVFEPWCRATGGTWHGRVTNMQIDKLDEEGHLPVQAGYGNQDVGYGHIVEPEETDQSTLSRTQCLDSNVQPVHQLPKSNLRRQ